VLLNEGEIIPLLTGEESSRQAATGP